jgi:hypothetical protein
MAPPLARIAFHLGMLALVLALIPLPFLQPGSAEFTAAVLAIILALVFLSAVAWDVRRQARHARPPEQEREQPRTPEGGERKGQDGDDTEP